jgi:hypothetical protein
VQQYFRSYADHFRLREHIHFGADVIKIEPIPQGAREVGRGDVAQHGASDDGDTIQQSAPTWAVTLATGEQRHYRGIVIANGHHWDPHWPTYPGHFNGQVLHSSQYKTPDQLAGQRVLVVGAGNSGCDIAVESAQFATATFHSMRRGYHFVPKFIKGKPADRAGEFFLRWHIPLWLRRRLAARAINISLGPPEEFGLPKPDHKLFESHPIINSQMMYFVGHGRIKPKPDVAELRDNSVRFADGSVEPIDTIVYATGFNLSFPFINPEHLHWHDGKPQLFLNVFHPTYDNLFVAGMIQPDSGLWCLSHYQSQLIARFVQLQQQEERRAKKFRRLKSKPASDLGNGIHYIRSSRHLLEIEHFSYRRKLQKLLAKFA